MKSMADALHDLGCPVSDRVLVLNVRAVLDPARSAQPADDLIWGMGSDRSGVVLQHHGTDAAGQHRVDY